MFKTALIPAAGRGARLDRKDRPKPLVEVGGEALLLRQIRKLKAAGVERFIVTTGYRAAEVERRLKTSDELSDTDLNFIECEAWEQGLAASLLVAKQAIREPFILAMADHIFEDSLVEQIAATSLDTDALVVLADRNVDAVAELASAVKLVTAQDRVRAAGRTLDGATAIDCGLFAATPELFDALEVALRDPSGKGELFSAVQHLAEQDRVRAEWTQGRKWFDIDTPASLIRAEMAFREQWRSQVVTTVAADALSGPAPIHYRFVTGKPETTDIVVQRGVVRQPGAIEIIPPQSASSPHFVFTDPRVHALYGEAFVAGLRASGYQVHAVVLPEGEAAKTLANYERCVDEVLTRGIDERSILISLGGGVVCNVCGFIASTLYRGIGLVHVPTTLMAQCDAAISHKQAVNGRRGKNMVGSYYAPSRIFIDIDTLATLDARLIPDGLAEVVKHALGQDAPFIRVLQEYCGDPRDPDFLEMVVKRNIELKCQLMKDDPKEHREGMVLQYGHTVGHPIEFLSGFELSHGEAVAIGMMIAVRVARILGGCGDSDIALHRELIQHYKLPTSIPDDISPGDIIEMLRYNKRYLTEGTRMALVSGPGQLWSVDDNYAIPVPDEVVRTAVESSYGEKA
jgi:3-dehydroquinate synthase